jgi:hypothetical protein
VFSDKYKDNGKIQLFKSLGFKVSDSNLLKQEFERQAEREYKSGNYTLGKLDRYGQRINISIIITNKTADKLNLFLGG